MKKEADKIRTVNTVQSTVMFFFFFFKLEDWDEVVSRFGTMLNNEKSLRFTVNLVPRVSLLPVPWSERERERDPGMVWSHASMKIEDVGEGSLYFNFCCHLFCHH